MHISTTCLCSAWLSVGLSPVVPTGTRPWVPFSTCQSTCARKAASSTRPPLKGVTSAVNDPWNFWPFAISRIPRNVIVVRVQAAHHT
jgi:hypothetical protein